MVVPLNHGPAAGRADGTADAEARLAQWERRTGPLLTAAAIVPVAAGLMGGDRTGPAVVIDLVSWALFLVDLVVHVMMRPRHLRSRLGMFDLAIVVVAAPWYLLPGAGSGTLLGLARLGRLARVFLVSTKNRRLRELGRRLGAAAVYSGVLLACCALVVRAVEPVESGYESFGDALWWAFVTFTTVGYGDYFPVTGTGRVTAVLLMLGGIALIGSLAATLASFLEHGDAGEPEGTPSQGAPSADAVAEELRRLRDEVRALRDELADRTGPSTAPGGLGVTAMTGDADPDPA